MENKRGFILGSITILIVATIAIVIILIVFIIGSSIVKHIETPSELKIYRAGEVGIGDVEDYMRKDYKNFVRVRARVGRGESVTKILGGEDEK